MMKPLFSTKSAEMPNFGPKIGLCQAHKIQRFIAWHLAMAETVKLVFLRYDKLEKKSLSNQFGKICKHALTSDYGMYRLLYGMIILYSIIVYLTGVFEDSRPQ